MLTFQEWLDDFGSEETRKIGMQLIAKEMEEIKARTPNDYTEAFYRKFTSDY